MSHSRPVGPDTESSQAQSHCQEPYYQAAAAGTLTCMAWSPWKWPQDVEEVPRCEPVCGRPLTPMIQNQEAHGSWKAELGSFPWQALVSIHGRGGGALLGDRWVLTAAHAIYPKDAVSLGRERRVDVFLGHPVLAELLRLGPRPVRRVRVHPDYRPGEPHNFDGDVALLELQEPVALGPSLLPVCLPDSERLYGAGVWGAVSGFGVDAGWLPSGLKASRLPVVLRGTCQAWLQERRRPEVFSDNMFCAGDPQRPQGVCQGDSGGAFVVWDAQAQRWVATGVVSWGVDCGQGYGFYTKVLNYVGWIKGVMSGKE
ncbi:LOW QUALITY PROTEIN: complement C1r subcomponent-like protein, partial [Sorex fumeus]|uniref:LOW QUALITY PROTEIN: complement C1r subcomponent-like protein n=1 Tax=Sorex fumeus TaxID=62283 RepID=UPI0024AE14B5